MPEAPQPELADSSARAEATRPGHSVLIEAPAGSGKTTLLVERYLRLLGSGDVMGPESVLAVTFTRKAAAEIRRRILAALRLETTEGTTNWAELARRRDTELGWRLAATPARLRVFTFDALAASIAGRMPWRARVGPAPRPSERPLALYQEAARRLLSGNSPDARELLRLGRARTSRLVDGLAELLKTRDQWQRLVTKAGADIDLRGSLEDVLGLRRASLLAVARELILASDPGATLPRLARRAADEARESVRTGPLGAWRKAQGLPSPTEEDWTLWLGLADLLLTASGEPRHGGSWVGLDDDEFESIRPSPELAAALQAIREAPGPALQPLDWDPIPPLLRLLPALTAELDAVFRERGECDFVAITEAAVAAMGESDFPSDLAFALDGSLRHILVDEFQDTSRVQMELLQALVREWQPEDGRSLFLVGDPMQSIYGFRDANLNNFIRLARMRDPRVESVPLTSIALQINLRSSAELVDWCNRLFQPLARHHIAATGNKILARAGVVLHNLPDDEPQTEARLIVELVRAELSQLPPDEDDRRHEIALLAERRKDLDAILPSLDSADLPFIGVDLFKLDQSPVVQDLLALTRALLDPADRVAWLALLRAPWCGLTLGDLSALCGDDADNAAPVRELLRDRMTLLSSDGRSRAGRFLESIESTLAAAGRVPPRGLVETCWRRLGADTLVRPEQRSHAAAFFNLLEDFTAGGDVLDRDLFEAEAARLYQPAAENESAPRLKIMTIHQAKGLQFDTVIVPGMHRHGWLGGAYPLLVWNGEVGDVLLANGLAGNLRRFVRAAQRVEEEAEQLRLMYVVCTRAVRRLHLVAHAPAAKPPQAASGLRRLWPALAADFPAPLSAVAVPPAPADASPPPLRRVAASWRPPAPAPGLRWQPPAATTRSASQPAYADAGLRGVGLAVHAILHRMARSSERQYEAARLAALLRSFGAHDAAAFQAAETALSRIAASPRGQWILAPHPEARNELALSGVVGNVTRFGILDRTFLDDTGTRWIIDYKTGSSPSPERRDEHRRQVETYAALLAAQYGDPLRCGLYYLLRDEWVEWTPDLTTSP